MSADREEIVYYYRGGIERGPHYEWHDGYSENNPSGGVVFPWMTKAECRSDAESNGKRARFTRWEEE